MKKSLSVLLGIVICLLIGYVSRMLHVVAMEEWYPFIVKSPLTPPDLVFPIVWCVLYVMMGISVGLLYSAKDIPSKKNAFFSRKKLLWLFVIQLLLNVSWNFFFFYMQNPMLGLANLLILVVLAMIYFIGALKVKRSVAFFFLPYLIWMCFASYLNWFIAMNICC